MDLGGWLCSLGLGEYEEVRDNKIDANGPNGNEAQG